MNASHCARPVIAWLFLLAALAVSPWSGRAAAGTVYQLLEQHPADHHACAGTKRFAEAIKYATNGRVFVEVHSNGKLFNQAQTIQALRHGGLVFALINTEALAAICPEMEVLCAPDVFANQQHREIALDGRAGQMLLDSLYQHGIVRLVFFDSDYGVDQPPDLLCVSRPIWEFMAEKDHGKIRRAAEEAKQVQDRAAEQYRASQTAGSSAGNRAGTAPRSGSTFLHNAALSSANLRDTYPEFFREVDFITSGFIDEPDLE